MIERLRPVIQLTLSPDAITRLDEMARRCLETRSGMVERLVLEAELPRRAAFPFGPAHRQALELVYAKNTAKGGGPALVDDVASNMRSVPLAVVTSILAELRKGGFLQRNAGGYETTPMGDLIATGDK